MEGNSSVITFGTIADVLDVAKLLKDAPAIGGGTESKETKGDLDLQSSEIIAGGSEMRRGAAPAKLIPRVPQVVHAAPALQGSWGPNSDAEARKRVVQAPVIRPKQAENPKRSLNTRCRVTAVAEPPRRTTPPPPPPPPPSPPSGTGNVTTNGALTTWASPAHKKRKKAERVVKIRSPGPPIAPAPVNVVKSPPTCAPGAPQPPTFAKVTPTSVQIEWSTPACDHGMPVSSYKLMVDNGHGGRLQRKYEGVATSYKASKLVPGLRYRAAVQAVNALGDSDLSGVAAVKLPPAEIKVSNKVHVKAKQKVTTLVVQSRKTQQQIQARETQQQIQARETQQQIQARETQQRIQARETQQQLWSPQTWRWARVVGVCATILAASVISVGTISLF